jgi:hypothetical protein
MDQPEARPFFRPEAKSIPIKMVNETLDFRRLMRLFAFMLIAFGLVTNCADAKNPLSIEMRSAKSGQQYSFIQINNAPVSLVDTEPDKNDRNQLLAIPIAFTSVSGKIVGVFVHDDKVDRTISKKLGGAIKVLKDRFEILDTTGGALLSKEYLNDLARNHGALVQQFLIVNNSKPCSFRDQGLAQRRGVGKFKDGKEFVVESKGFITLTKFTNDMVELGVKNCLYSDLGAWGQSWVRDPKTNKLTKLANEKSVTENHTNWLLVSDAKD